VVIGDDGSGGQRLRFWVDTDQDGDFADETTLIDSTAVDDDWTAGLVGLFRSNGYGDRRYFYVKDRNRNVVALSPPTVRRAWAVTTATLRSSNATATPFASAGTG
jgi:hypothetical protein